MVAKVLVGSCYGVIAGYTCAYFLLFAMVSYLAAVTFQVDVGFRENAAMLMWDCG